jgi:hypothetical protein
MDVTEHPTDEGKLQQEVRDAISGAGDATETIH